LLFVWYVNPRYFDVDKFSNEEVEMPTKPQITGMIKSALM